MSNETQIRGNQNIVIQEMTESTLTINVNGDICEIRKELADLKNLLEKQNVQHVLFAEKSYNIAHFDEAQFSFVSGKKAFNEHLTKQLMEAIRPYSSAARQLLDTVDGIPDWESQARFSDSAKAVISCSFVGVIGIQLRKLTAIGKADLSEEKQREYIVKCIDISKHCLFLLSIASLSRIWDEQQQTPRPFTEAERKALKSFFDNFVEPSLLERFQFLQVLREIFANPQYDLVCPLPEWPEFAQSLTTESDLYRSCQQLTALNDSLEKNPYNLLDCYEAERQLTILLQNVAFLVNYGMASIRHIGYRQPRNTDAHYMHHYTALGVDKKANVDAEKINCTCDTVQTHAVLLYRGSDYREYTSLSPFVIDYNALTFEKGAKICFYSAKIIETEILEYRFLEDNSILPIEKQDILKSSADLNEIMFQPEKQQVLNLDNVVDQFMDARRCLVEGNTDTLNSKPTLIS